MKFRMLPLVLILIFLVGCSSNDPTDPTYDIIGKIDSINHSQSGNITSCLVVATDSSSIYKHAHIRIIGDTMIIIEDSNTSIEPGALREGMLVGVIFKGAIAESDPIQVNAGKIVIFD